jgi:hypothetical protein
MLMPHGNPIHLLSVGFVKYLIEPIGEFSDEQSPLVGPLHYLGLKLRYTQAKKPGARFIKAETSSSICPKSKERAQSKFPGK